MQRDSPTLINSVTISKIFTRKFVVINITTNYLDAIVQQNPFLSRRGYHRVSDCLLRS